MKKINSLQFSSAGEKRLLSRCRAAVKEIDPTADIILYGSRARGTAEAESDYDLLILVDGDISLEKEDCYRRRLYPLELETGAVLTVIVTSKANWNSPLYAAMPLYRNIRREGVFL